MFITRFPKLWEITPWDFNASFGMWNTNLYTPSEYPIIPDAIANGCIAENINDIPELKGYYLDAMCELINSVGDTSVYFKKIDNFKTQIQQAVYDDKRKHITDSDFDNATEYGFKQLFGENQPSLKTFLTQRLAVISDGLMDKNYSCLATSIDHNLVEVKEIKIYPNPASDFIKIKLPNDYKDNYTLQIINSVGQIVYFTNKKTEINIQNLISGIYFVQVKNGQFNYTEKIIKQ